MGGERGKGALKQVFKVLKTVSKILTVGGVLIENIFKWKMEDLRQRKRV